LGGFFVVFAALGTVERALATISILSWLSFFGFCFFLSLLATISFSRSFSGRRFFWIASVQETRGTQMACLSTKTQSTDDFSLIFKTKATARARFEKALLSTSSSEEESSFSGRFLFCLPLRLLYLVLLPGFGTFRVLCSATKRFAASSQVSS
jgi:hypothetical protein